MKIGKMHKVGKPIAVRMLWRTGNFDGIGIG